RLDRVLADVGSEDLQRDRSGALVEQLERDDRQRTDLLPGRAPGDPKTEGGPLGGMRQQPTQDRLLQRGERGRLAKERGDVDQQLLLESLQLGGRAPQHLHVCVQAWQAMKGDPPFDSPLQGRKLVAGVVESLWAGAETAD